jgi:hypothetical protein
MGTRAKFVSAALLSLCIGDLRAADIPAVPAKDEITLVSGYNDLQVDDMHLRIVKGVVGTLNAHSYTTYTTYVLPDKQGGQWMQVTVPGSRGDEDGLAFTTIRSAESDSQDIAFYRQNGKLFGVQATRKLTPTSLENTATEIARSNAKPTEIGLTILQFNQDWDVPMFNRRMTIESRGRYLNAGDAISKEIFSH